MRCAWGSSWPGSRRLLHCLLICLMLLWSGPLAAQQATRFDSQADTAISVVLLPRHEAVLSCEVGGKVTQIHYELGQRFKKGSLLLKLDPWRFSLRLKEAKAQLALAKEKFATEKGLHQDGAASRLELAEAQNQLDLARVNHSRATKELALSRLTAPFDGSIEKLMVNHHEIVQPGQPVMKIIASRVLWGKMLVPSAWLKRIKLGQLVQIRQDHIDNQLSGQISHIGAAMDPASGTFEVYLEVQNPKGALKSGMTGQLLTNH
jgi:membrane fusion protein (multidrug efflux system)